MIKGITGGQGIVAGGGSMNYPYVPQNPNNPIQGMIRLNGQDMQVFDGSSWTTLSASYAHVSLDQETQDLLMWARAQRTMALNRMTLAQNNPALMKALEAVKRAEDNFEILSKFVENDLDAELRELAP
jgi:hypothetical protein